jgi:hypothetical protein
MDNAMPHQFTETDGPALQGIWLKTNGRRYCTWQFDRSSGELRASRGVVVHKLNLEAADEDEASLKEKLPGLVLDLLKNPPRH